MLKNYLIIALRNAWRHKSYSLLNITGLAVGVAVCFLIFLWVRDELAHDRFHEHANDTYRVLWDARFGDNEWTIPVVGSPVAPTLEREYPEVETAVQIAPATRTLRTAADYVIEPRFFLTESSFFDVFTVRFLEGDPGTALSTPDAVVLTRETARRYFSGQSALGETLELNDGSLLRVTAVVEPFPDQSHLAFDFLAPLSSSAWYEARREQWGSASVMTYVRLRPDADADALAARFNEFVSSQVADNVFAESGNYTRYLFQPLTRIHLYSGRDYGIESAGNITYVYIFSLVGLIILALAAINFVNLATARSASRAKEVGVRKALGSPRAQLIRQFLTESFVYVACALLIGLLLAHLALPVLNQLSGKELSAGYLSSPGALLALAAIGIAVGLGAGLYPAVFLASFRPAFAMSGSAAASARNLLRNGLVVLQFCISIALIVGTLVIRQQLQYVQAANLGFDREHVLVVEGAGALRGQHSLFVHRLTNEPGIVRASAVQTLPGRFFDSTVFVPEQPANYEATSLTYLMADEHLIDVLNLNIVEGRNFSADFATDSTALLINQSAARALGWEDPVGRRIGFGDQMAPVIGVVEDFHYASLHEAVQPLVMPYLVWSPSYIAVRLHPRNVQHQITMIQALWHELVPARPFQYSFLDADLQKLYESEQNVAQVFSAFSALAVFIACLGLFGLAAFTAEQRTKEIGVRKVMGASVASIVALMSKDFARLVLIAAVIAAPIGYFAMNRWLEDFAYRIEISWWIYAIAGGIALVIALFTVSSQAVKAAVRNPVEALRYE